MMYATLRDKIAAEKRERSIRYARFAEWWEEAHAAGIAAGEACKPSPMLVRNGAIRINGQPLRPGQADDAIVDVVPDGVCGFSWVTLHPATSSFARWAVKERQARKEYGGGLCLVWVSQFNQSLARKEAYAQAFADVLRSHGLQAFSHSRMD